MDCTGVYDTDGNLTNVTISAEKKAEILSTDFTGSGTSTDPYQVNSSLGFWFMSKFVTLTNCYVELNCDVILNDETFDENGNASGGDGVVYGWKNIGKYSNLNFNGNNKKIYGIYHSIQDENTFFFYSDGNCIFSNLVFNNIYMFNETKSSCLFKTTYGDIVENVTILKNSYMYGLYTAGIGYFRYKKISNCKVYACLSGKFEGAGIALYGDSTLNCDFYGKLCISDSDKNRNFGGILSGSNSSNIYIENCNNYGEFVSKEQIADTSQTNRLGGIVGLIGQAQIVNCKNYASIDKDKISLQYSGGIVGLAYHGNGYLIKNCINYADNLKAPGIVNESGVDGTGTIVGCVNYGNIMNSSAIVGHFSRGNLIVKNCKNFGTLTTDSNNSTLGMLISVSNSKGNFEMINCEVDCDILGKRHYNYGIIGYAVCTNITFNNCRIKYNDKTTSGAGRLLPYVIRDYQHVVMENMQFDITISNDREGVLVDELKGRLDIKNCVFKWNGAKEFAIYYRKNTESNFSGKNILILCENNYFDGNLFRNNTESDVQGIVYKNTQGKSYYYGSNFSDFYIAWRTGKIGLKALDGVGYFQGAIDEEWLANNGYTKKD